MPKITNEDLLRKLIGFGHRPLKKGEVFILAKVISDRLPLGSGFPENIRTYTLNLRKTIDSAIYGLSDYIYLPADTVQRIYELIDNLLLWRMTVAFKPSRLVYTGDPTMVVDETSCILRFVDVSDICSVSEISETAGFIASVFQDYLDAQ